MDQRVISHENFKDALKLLAEASAVAFSLKNDLSPLTPEDIQMGAAPLDQGQIQPSLDEIITMLTQLALNKLQASNLVWYAANDSMQ